MNRSVALDDKYTLNTGRAYLTGTQALVKLPMLQRQRDLAAGLNTAAFISGYRGSPLGGFDMALWKARDYLKEHHIHFQPGVNEDLGATAVWGSQQVNLFDGANYDGVFGMWYGKGPGVDRSGDVFKHANSAGTSQFGGVLAIAGDDHTCKSSTLAHQSEYAFMDAQMPVLNPSGVQEILDFGLIGWALSRFSGCWVGFKTIAETVDSSISADLDPSRVSIVMPQDFDMPAGGLHARWPDPPLVQERRLQQYKVYAALAFARANTLNRITLDSEKPRVGIVSTGKSYLDVMQALDDLHIDKQTAQQIGLRVLKVGMSWPLEREGIREFAEGLEEIIVVEEKRAVIENQLKEQLYNWREEVRPRVVGKFDEAGEWILPSTGELTPAQVARVIARRIKPFYDSDAVKERLSFLEEKEKALEQAVSPIARVPHFCSGCPHNTSTKVPEGSRALAGIGCHYMAIWMDRRTETFSQMGGEGVAWIGQSPFTETEHVFVNLGDGTYFHSGLLAIRAAVAADVNVTYKLLYNDAVAMTGGQPIDGQLSVEQITHQLYGEGVRMLKVVSDEPEKYTHQANFAAGVTVHHRDELDALQRTLRKSTGVSVIIYDQTCATEKRRRRKRGLMPEPKKRLFINKAVCEGCGDCGEKSNCLSIIPVETPFGRKRAIDQSACNKDFMCNKGFCPSFVSVVGGKLKVKQAMTESPEFKSLPEPIKPSLDMPYNIVVTGVGGTGIVTIGAIIGMASHIEERGISVLDMAGLAQKYGAVVSHIRIAVSQNDIHTVRIPAGEANVVIGGDLIVASSFDTLAKTDPQNTNAVINSYRSMPSSFTQTPDLEFPAMRMQNIIRKATRSDNCTFIDATDIATRLFGDSVFANLFLLGYAYQSGYVPIKSESLTAAIELNGVAIEKNIAAFNWGRLASHSPSSLPSTIELNPAPAQKSEDSLEGLLDQYASHLKQYQNTALAERYINQVRAFESIDEALGRTDFALSKEVARTYVHVLAYKDEYEVARLYSSDEFWSDLSDKFEGDYQVKFNLAPPILASNNPDGLPSKREFGQWMIPVFKILAGLRFLRGTKFDIFGYSEDRKLERLIIDEYEILLGILLRETRPDNYDVAVELASSAAKVRGYGYVKKRAYDENYAVVKHLLRHLRNVQGEEQAA
ncbi:MAG: indolepyruvate ferredoxin oxidoreductase family protein [Pseudomonadota bacterium]